MTPCRDGRTVFVEDAHGANLGFLVTQGTGVVAWPIGRLGGVFFASWLKALGWMTMKGKR